MKAFSDNWRLWVLAAYALIVGALLIYVGEPRRVEWWPASIGFWLYALVPVALLCLGRTHVRLKGFAAVMMALGGVWGFGRAMLGIGTTSTSALVFVVLPVYQLVAALLFLGLLWLLDRFGGGEES